MTPIKEQPREEVTALIESLRVRSSWTDQYDPVTYNLFEEAADALEALSTAHNNGRREALEEAAKVADIWAKTQSKGGPSAPFIAAGCREAGEQIAASIRALANNPASDLGAEGETE